MHRKLVASRQYSRVPLLEQCSLLLLESTARAVCKYPILQKHRVILQAAPVLAMTQDASS